MRIFAVGNNDYPRNPLSGCIADAMSWKEFFKDTKGVVSVATNAKRSQIEAGLAWVAERGGLFIYSGHGTLTYRNGILCEAICPIDMAEAGSIADYEIAKLLTARGKPVVCILDCCHGNNEFYGRQASLGHGATTGPLLTSRYIETEKIDTTDLECRAAVGSGAGLWAKTNVALLNACKSNQSSYEGKVNGVQRGYFTTALQAVYKPEYSLREWLNRAGKYIRTQYDCDIQTPRAIGNEALLKEALK